MSVWWSGVWLSGSLHFSQQVTKRRLLKLQPAGVYVSSNDRPPPMPLRPSFPEKRPRSIWSVVMALLFGFALFIGLAFLASALGPVVLAIGGIVFVLVVFAAGHYLLWGYWLGDSIRREVEEEEANRRARDQ
jgi:hypothetical protein